jgi:hypothetical protein
MDCLVCAVLFDSLKYLFFCRKYSFDIDLQTKNRTFRFAAPDETMFGKWLNVVIQV